MAPKPGGLSPSPHLVVGQPDPERGPQAADGLGEEGLAVGVGDGGQGGVEGLAEQQGLVPPEGFLQDAVSAVVVKEGAGGRGGVRRPRGAQERVWGSKETRSEAAPAYRGGRLLAGVSTRQHRACMGHVHLAGDSPSQADARRFGGAPQTAGARCSPQAEPILLPPPHCPMLPPS